MLSPAKAIAPSTAKKRQWYSGHDTGVDSKRRRGEDDDKARKFSTIKAALEAVSSSLKTSEISSAGELCRGRRRWRSGSEPRDWDDREWYIGNSTVASDEDTPEKQGCKATIKASTSAPDSDEDHQPFAFELFDISATNHCQTYQRLAYEKSEITQHSGKGTGLSCAAFRSSKVQNVDHDER
ncbi:hypothetical protein ACQKWADRAFT_266613 [Trichoderma austrokoningii]